MGTVGYSGGVADPAFLRPWELALPSPMEDAPWRVATDDQEWFLRSSGMHCYLVDLGPVAVLLRGLAVSSESGGSPNPERVARTLGERYLETGRLEVDDLEGSFSVAVLDSLRGRAVLYRNLMGASFTYYTQAGGGLLFGSNLADLVRSLPAMPSANLAVLPTYFLFRFVPGRQTLFDGVFRLLPGEEVRFEGGKVTRRQRHTFADLRRGQPLGGDAAERVEATLERVLTDYRTLQPQAANLLSGGVDSSLIQAVWNRTAPAGVGSASFSVTVDHACTHGDTEYAQSAARALGTRHTLVPADTPYAECLQSLIGAMGEPPNHVQAAYFGPLARVMLQAGRGVGLCGEGADSLFGTCYATGIQDAQLLHTLLPLAFLRRWGARAAAWLGFPTLSGALQLASQVGDLAFANHPVNLVAVFTDDPAVRACFGDAAVDEAFAGRRDLVQQLQAGPTPLEAVHAVGYLGESSDSAALWTGLFNREGGDLFCPFLDSRVLRLALELPTAARFPFRQPKGLLRRVLARYTPPTIASRNKRGFGQPIFEWLAPGGQLHPLVEQIGTYDFVDPQTLARCRERPNWFLYSLLCYDLWHKQFIEGGGLPESVPQPRTIARLA